MAGTQEPAEEGHPSAGFCVLWRADDPEDDDLTYVQVNAGAEVLKTIAVMPQNAMTSRAVTARPLAATIVSAAREY